MAERTTLARPYARAVFELAEKPDARRRWSEWLDALTQVVTHPEVVPLLTSPRLTADELAGVVAEAAGELNDQGKNFVRVVAAARRLQLMPEIRAIYEHLRAEAEGAMDVEVVSAKPLDQEQQERLAIALQRRLGREIRLHATVDDSLIGGAVICAGDTTIDGSVQGKLERLSSALVH